MDYPIAFLLEASTKVDPNAATSAADGAAAASGNIFQTNPLMMIVIYCAAIFAAMYFFSIKPQKKKEQQLQDLRNNIKVGDSVLLTSGLYGKVTDITAECFVVEFGTNKGIRIPVVKEQIYTVREPNLSNKAEEIVEEKPEKKGLFGFGKKKDAEKEDK